MAEISLSWPKNQSHGKKSISSTDCLARLIGKGRKLVTFFNQLTSASDFFHDRPKIHFSIDDPRRTHNLKQDCVTRWNSMYDMLERLDEQSPTLVAMCMDEILSKKIQTTLNNTVFSFYEQPIVAKVVKLLKPFYNFSLCRKFTHSSQSETHAGPTNKHHCRRPE